MFYQFFLIKKDICTQEDLLEIERYEGNFICSNREGQGRLMLINGDVYSGEFLNVLLLKNFFLILSFTPIMEYYYF